MQLAPVVRKALSWLDANALLYCSLFLLIFIPLYPKLPLFDAIPGYLVRVRIEDILVLIMGGIWLLQFARHKITAPKVFLFGVLIYVMVGIFSLVSGMLLLKTIPLEFIHIAKSGLHFFRYLEYFSVFFFLFSGITSLKQVKVAVILLAIVVVVASIYGYGQKNWQWPVFSTMNREYSKGAQLALGENARVQSTFAGHYDLAAFLVIVVPLLFALTLTSKKIQYKALFGVTILLGCWLLFASGSKTAFLAFAVGLYVTLLLYLQQFPRLFKAAVLGTVVAVLLGGGVVGYFWANPQDTSLVQGLDSLKNSTIVQQISPLAQITTKAHSFFAKRATGDQATPADVFGSDASGQVWSENAIKYGLSMGIRLDTLWPQAIRGLFRNIVLGSGYGTLSKNESHDFVEADSTDNNYLRVLGEVGLLGFVIFFGLVLLLLKVVSFSQHDDKSLSRAISIGFIGATIGLLCNALIIDVFVASKVAFTFWALAGLATKTIYLQHPQPVKAWVNHVEKSAQSFLSTWWPALLSLVVVLLLVQRNPLYKNSLTHDFTINPEQVEALTTARCWLTGKGWELCRAETALPSSTSYVYGGLLALAYSLTTNLGAYYYVNLLLLCIAMISSFALARKVLKKSEWVALPLLLLAIVIATTSFFFMPVDANAGLGLFPLAAFLWLTLRETRSKIALLLSILVTALGFSLLPSFDVAEFGYAASPLVLVVIAFLIQKTTQLPTLKDFNYPVVRVVLATTLLMSSIWLLDLPSHFSHTLTEYQRAGKGERVTTIHELNTFFGQQRFAAQKPYLLTTLNPYLVDLSSNGQYTLLPLTLNQTYGYKAEAVWGSYTYSSPESLTDSLLRDNKQVFLSGFNLTDTAQKAFDTLKERFNANVVSLGCGEMCSIYQLEPEGVSTALPTQPKTINAKTLSLRETQPYSFIVFNNRFNIHVPKKGHTTKGFLYSLNHAIAQKPDFMVITGDLTNDNGILEENIFRRGFISQVTFPVVFNAGNFDDIKNKLFVTPYQNFKTPHIAFILITTDESGRVEYDQQLSIYNALLDIEKDKSLKNIFVITQRHPWVAKSNGYEPMQAVLNQPPTEWDAFYHDSLLPKLRALSDRKTFVVSGDFRFSPQTTLFYDVDERDGITYVASSANYDPNDAYLRFNVDSNGTVSITPLSPQGASLQSIEEYGLAYWQKVVPELKAPQDLVVTPPKPLGVLPKILISLGVVAASVLLFEVGHRFLQPFLKRHLRLPLE